MIAKADAVVIGGGILGGSTAHFLTKIGYGQIVLVEKSTLCSGATKYSAAVVRQHYSNEVAIRLAVRAIEMFQRSETELGGPTGFVQCGYLLLSPRGGEAAVRRLIPLQQRLGVDTKILSLAEAASIFPDLDYHHATLTAFEAKSGYADPRLTVESLVSSAQSRGAKIYTDTRVVGIRVRSGRVTGVVTTKGTISTRVVVNAAGPWANQIGEMVGTRYSLRFSREQEVIFQLTGVPVSMPVVSDPYNRTYIRPDGNNRVLIGFGFPKQLEPCDPDSYNTQADESAVTHLAAKLRSRLPAAKSQLAAPHYVKAAVDGYAGVYSITDDWYPIVGPGEDVDGFFEAVGGSGHCFKIGPPIGEALADTIAGRRPLIDISSLGRSRFAEGRAFESAWGPGNRA